MSSITESPIIFDANDVKIIKELVRMELIRKDRYTKSYVEMLEKIESGKINPTPAQVADIINVVLFSHSQYLGLAQAEKYDRLYQKIKGKSLMKIFILLK